jgi:hypothetical protein
VGVFVGRRGKGTAAYNGVEWRRGAPCGRLL